MKDKFLLILIISFIFIIHCDKAPEEGETQTLSSVSEITFGTSWNDAESTLSAVYIDTIFDQGTETIFYQAKFDSACKNWFMIEKLWTLNSETLFTSVTLIPIGTKRVCGEFRKYNAQPLDTGNYQISILYFQDTSYIGADYDFSVNRQFRIE